MELHKPSSSFFSRKSAGQKGVARYIYSNEREKPTIKITLPSKDLIQIWWWNQKLYRQIKAKRIQLHQISFTTDTKGTFLARSIREKKVQQKHTLNN